MKKILLAFVLILGMKTQAQTFKTSLTSQAWAGGMCCRSGVNYTLTITGNAAELEKLVIIAVCVDKNYFDQVKASPVVTINGNSYRTYQFSSVYNEYAYDHDTHPVKVETKSCDENKIYLNGDQFLMIESRNALPYLAYP